MCAQRDEDTNGEATAPIAAREIHPRRAEIAMRNLPPMPPATAFAVRDLLAENAAHAYAHGRADGRRIGIAEGASAQLAHHRADLARVAWAREFAQAPVSAPQPRQRIRVRA